MTSTIHDAALALEASLGRLEELGVPWVRRDWRGKLAPIAIFFEGWKPANEAQFAALTAWDKASEDYVNAVAVAREEQRRHPDHSWILARVDAIRAELDQTVASASPARWRAVASELEVLAGDIRSAAIELPRKSARYRIVPVPRSDNENAEIRMGTERTTVRIG